MQEEILKIMSDWQQFTGVQLDTGIPKQSFEECAEEIAQMVFDKIGLRRVTSETARLIDDEINRAKTKFKEKNFNSTHEGFAVLKEEVDELWDEVKQNGTKERLRLEAIQVAAMAIRFINELTEPDMESGKGGPL